MIERHSLPHANAAEFFKKQRVYALLSFKREHDVSLFVGSGLQQNEGARR